MKQTNSRSNTDALKPIDRCFRESILNSMISQTSAAELTQSSTSMMRSICESSALASSIRMSVDGQHAASKLILSYHGENKVIYFVAQSDNNIDDQ